MSIPVIYYDNTEDFVPDITLEQLLSAHRIKMFYRFSEGWVTVEAGILRGKGGAIPEMYGKTYSGPERRVIRQQEAAGEEARQLWHGRELAEKIYEESPIGIGICDSFGKLLDANRVCLDIFGLDPVTGTGAFNLFINPEIPDEAIDRLRRAETVRYQLTVDFDRGRASGLYSSDKSGVISLDMVVSPVMVPSSGMCLYVVQMQDITAQKAAEEKFLAIKHREGILEHAGGIVHDFNNLLQVILGNITLARQCASAGQSGSNFLERAENAALQAHKLAGDLTARPHATDRGKTLLSDKLSLVDDRCPEVGGSGPDDPDAGGTRASAGRVLVMDDTESVRRIAGAFLLHAGYDVEFAEDGAEAARIYEAADRRGRPFDAVLLDLTVPGGSGAREAIRIMLDVDPYVRAIVSSGYHDDPVMTGFWTYGFKGAIAKPYTLQELTAAVEAVIRGD